MLFPVVQVEPNTKLFPAVFVRPSSPNLFQFELAKIKVGSFFIQFLFSIVALIPNETEVISQLLITSFDRQALDLPTGESFESRVSDYDDQMMSF